MLIQGRRGWARIRLVAFVLGAAPILLASGTVVAANLGFLRGSAVTRFNPEDFRLQEQAALVLLKDGDVGRKQDWSNPNSTAKGTITVVKIFHSADGFACKSLQIQTSAQGIHSRWTFPVCEIEPGDWHIHAGAKPAPVG